MARTSKKVVELAKPPAIEEIIWKSMDEQISACRALRRAVFQASETWPGTPGSWKGPPVKELDKALMGSSALLALLTELKGKAWTAMDDADRKRAQPDLFREEEGEDYDDEDDE